MSKLITSSLIIVKSPIESWGFFSEINFSLSLIEIGHGWHAA